MLKRISLLIIPLLVLFAVFCLSPARSAIVTPPKGTPSKPAPPKAAPSEVEKPAAPKVEGECYPCHEEIKSLKAGNSHDSLSCTVCHDKVAEHLGSSDTLPLTNLELSLCGRCHPFSVRDPHVGQSEIEGQGREGDDHESVSDL